VDRFILMALAAAEDALADAKIEIGRDVDPERVAVIVGSGAGGLTTYEAQTEQRLSRGRTGVSAYLLPGMLPNMAAARIAIRHGARGVSSAPATACAAGADAIAEAYRMLQLGEADVAICGGTEAPLSPTGALAFKHALALAHGWDDPTAASRPFEVRRNGFVLGEGSGVLVIERTAHADARGAIAYADLAGWGASTDAYRPTTPLPDGSGATVAMRRALASAGMSPVDIDHVNAHGTGTKLGDVAEIRAIRQVFGSHSPAVSSTKSLTGHLLGGSGAVEAAFTCLAIARGLMPPTHNLESIDPECAADHVRGAPRVHVVGAAISNSFGFGGHNVSLAFVRPSTQQARSG
jgi:3-oxoacyl-[acyl-carrier-protein] synthase II